jgi:hypothetical protein
MWLDKQLTFSVISKGFQDVSRAYLLWAEDSAVRFEWSKTEAILFLRSPKTRQQAQEQDIDLVSSWDKHYKVRWN